MNGFQFGPEFMMRRNAHTKHSSGAGHVMLATRSRRDRTRSLRPVLTSLEDRTLLNAAMPHHSHDPHVSAQVHTVGHLNKNSKPTGPPITFINQVSAGGF